MREIEVQNEQYIEIQCLEAIQPIGSMYIAIINCGDLETICFADVRRMEIGIENREVEDYIGIQRELNPNRENEIGKYVNLIDATFPNSIILSISSDYATYNPETHTMKILYKDDVAKVLDGQHRIAGLRHFERDQSQFQLIVTIYIDMELEDQAIVFATINKEQKNVSNSLVADLFAFAKTRSPQKTAHNIARALNKKEGSPFYKKIKILGTAVNKETETITQDTFVKSLLKYITSDPQSDRNFYKVHKDKDSKLPLISGKELHRLFLRNIFILDDNDIQIAQIIFNYFYAVSMKWPDAWNSGADNNILNKSTGFSALMRFFKDAYLSFNRIGEIISKDDFIRIFASIQIPEANFTKEVYIPGSSGQGQLYRDLLSQSGLGKLDEDMF
ncbi:DGQHR domain-containing protein [Pedobacter cryoconitis]|uniref:DGQHR domain-containing protein n=1 Tax=Pedobacter cryoconitis TaxID=188932 RepID=A0A127VKL7_9SPHI|nr:DGQHR domain-containing protein [Pedobacter cryoconitis]AMQ01857.1 DGQHR domain-containing protein [Pedobacter cryoconitis]